MNTRLASISVFIASILGFAGGSFMQNYGNITTDPDIKILSDYIYAQVRLGEVPTLDLSIVTPEQMTAAYTQEIQDQQIADPQPDLFKTLRDKAVREGIACQKL